MPRTFLMTVDRFLTDRVTPGNRVKVVGVLSITKRQNGGNADVNAGKGPKDTV